MQHIPNVPFGEEDEERLQQHVRAIETYTSFMCDTERHYWGGAMCVVPATLAATRRIIIWCIPSCIHSEGKYYPVVNCAIHKPGVVKNG